jgi:hypothetical protein
MQLEDLNSYVIICPGDFLHSGKILSVYIDCPPEDNLTFSYNLSQHKRFCPRLFDAFGESKKPLKKRSRDERVYLKQKLLEDMEANIAAADAQFGGEKRLGTDILPSDPDACMERLGHMESELHAQIQALERKLGHVGSAQDTLESIQKKKLELDAFDKTPFMTLPQKEEEHSVDKKKARRG